MATEGDTNTSATGAVGGEELTGGCFCGSVRYRLKSTPYDTGWCHCRICQKITGSPALVFTTVPLKDFVVEKGSEHMGKVKTTAFGERQFCKLCGSPLTIHIAHQPDELDLPVPTLDEPEKVVPTFHIYYASRIPWAEAADTCPRYDKLRPNTRGLPSGATSTE
jgi:hypothetical protein